LIKAISRKISMLVDPGTRPGSLPQGYAGPHLVVSRRNCEKPATEPKGVSNEVEKAFSVVLAFFLIAFCLVALTIYLVVSLVGWAI
jgi:hypothetical protein